MATTLATPHAIVENNPKSAHKPPVYSIWLPCLSGSGKYEITDAGSRWLIAVFSPRLAGRLNKILEHYPFDYRFQEGEEPLFQISKQAAAGRLAQVRAVLGIRGT